jgi:hypothetical protein
MRPVTHFECVAGTTGLEPATSAVTAKRKVVTYRKQASRMASFGAVRNDWEPLSNPYQTHDLCPVNLCPNRNLAQRVHRSVLISCSRFSRIFLPFNSLSHVRANERNAALARRIHTNRLEWYRCRWVRAWGSHPPRRPAPVLACQRTHGCLSLCHFER